MLARAIILVGVPSPMRDQDAARCTLVPAETMAGNHIACLDILGESVLDRTIRRLQAADIGSISVVADAGLSHLAPSLALRHVEIVLARRPVDGWTAADRKLQEYSEAGVENVAVIRLGAYAEFDFRDLLKFHSDGGRTITRTCDRRGALDFWILNVLRFRDSTSTLKATLVKKEDAGASPYLVDGYVNRLADARDLRRLVVDAFLSHSAILPAGNEVRPGVWLEDDAEVHRRARVVAPAYIGKGAQVHASALITRFSSLERGCNVDCGTVVEDSSLLAHTYVGAGLDVCHAVVYGGTLAHLGYDVTVDLNDKKLAGTTIQGGFGHRASTGRLRSFASTGAFSGLLSGSWRRQMLSPTGST